jgi:ABC-type sugar transport system ATPase subunit
MAKIAATGRIVVLVTHRLGDLVAHAARVAIIRDGRVRALLAGSDLSEEGIARQLVVDSDADVSSKNAAVAAAARAREAIVAVRGWSQGDVFHDVALSARPGEIVALMGVEGSGARELLRSLGGLERCSGAIEIAGETGQAAERSTAYVPATRLLSLYGNFSVGENLLARLGRPDIAGFGLRLKRKAMRERAVAAVVRFQVKARTIAQSIRSLSGGNQQKVAIAQALHRKPRVLLLEEPTRGVDIRSKREIYRLLRDYAAEGNVVIMFCTEVLEVFEAADRAFVVAEGSLSREIAVHEYDHVERLATDITRLERHVSPP